MPKKLDLQQSFSEQHHKLRHRVFNANKGLTLRQSKLALEMLAYLQDREKRLTKQAEDAMSDAEYTKMLDERLIANWNGLTDFLSQEFSMKVLGGVNLEDRSEIWAVESPSGKSEHKTMWQAFQAGIQASLSGSKEEVK